MESVHCKKCLNCFLIMALDQIDSNYSIFKVNKYSTTNLKVTRERFVMCKSCSNILGSTDNLEVYNICIRECVSMITRPINQQNEQ